MTYEELRNRLTRAEREAVLSPADWRVRDFTHWALANHPINLYGLNAAAAKVLLVTLGLLTEARADEVFA